MKLRIGRSAPKLNDENMLALEAILNKIPQDAINRRKFRKTDAVSNLSALLGRRQVTQAPEKKTQKFTRRFKLTPMSSSSVSLRSQDLLIGLLIRAEYKNPGLFLMDNIL